MSKWIVTVINKRVDNFKLVDKIPRGYQIWNIGSIEGFPTFLPLCRCYPGTYKVMLDKLLAIDLGSEDKVRLLTRCSSMTGASNIKQAKSRLKKPFRNLSEKELVESVLPLLESISE